MRVKKKQNPRIIVMISLLLAVFFDIRLPARLTFRWSPPMNLQAGMQG